MARPFSSILCGVEGHSASTEAARQAIALAGEEGEVNFIAVYTSFELGPDYHKDTLEESLDEAAMLAGRAGVPASTQLHEARYAIDVLLPQSEQHDLLVLGTHGKSRASGIVFGSTASEAAHGTERPLLIARETPNSGSFPAQILLATDGSPDSWAAARAGAGLAAVFEIGLAVVCVTDDGDEEREAILDAQLLEIEKATGGAPEVLRPAGGATKEILASARSKGASLIVSGRRGLRGIKALGSVSERIVSGAECSVLLVPADGDA